MRKCVIITEIYANEHPITISYDYDKLTLDKKKIIDNALSDERKVGDFNYENSIIQEIISDKNNQINKNEVVEFIGIVDLYENY